MVESCIFCELGTKETIFKDDELYVIKDINPVAKLHYLIIPLKHVGNWDQDQDLYQKAMNLALRFTGSKYIRINFGSYQQIPHAHIHVISDQEPKEAPIV